MVLFVWDGRDNTGWKQVPAVALTRLIFSERHSPNSPVLLLGKTSSQELPSTEVHWKAIKA